MKIKSCLLGLTLAVTTSLSLHADVTFNIAGAYLYGETFEQPLTNGSLIIVVTSPTGTYSGPTAGSLTSGDERLLFAFGADEDVLGESGGFATTINFNLDASIVSGNSFALLWFPSLVLGDVPTGGEAYGFYVDPSWLIPVDGAFESYAFETVNVGGTIPDSAGLASLTVPGEVIPEPSTFAAIAGLAVIGAVATRRRRSA